MPAIYNSMKQDKNTLLERSTLRYPDGSIALPLRRSRKYCTDGRRVQARGQVPSLTEQGEVLGLTKKQRKLQAMITHARRKRLGVVKDSFRT